jgi:hypothetical protein
MCLQSSINQTEMVLFVFPLASSSETSNERNVEIRKDFNDFKGNTLLQIIHAL